MQVCFHILENQIQILIILGSDDIVQFDNVGMIEFMQKYDLSIGPLGVCGMLESIKYFFESEDISGFFVVDFPDMPIGSTANFFNK